MYCGPLEYDLIFAIIGAQSFQPFLHLQKVFSAGFIFGNIFGTVNNS